MAKPYNRHLSYNAWNVSLWFNNDEGLYRMMRHAVAAAPNRAQAARDLFTALNGSGATETPDGVPYTVTNIRRAMVGI